MQRHLLGISALLLLAIAAGMLLADSGEAARGTRTMFIGACVRVGMVLAAGWLAWPQLARLFARVSPIALIGLMTVAIVLAFRPKLLVILGPLLILVALLHVFGWFTKPASPARRSGERRKTRVD